jgi:hypothetical protein
MPGRHVFVARQRVHGSRSRRDARRRRRRSAGDGSLALHEPPLGFASLDASKLFPPVCSAVANATVGHTRAPGWFAPVRRYLALDPPPTHPGYAPVGGHPPVRRNSPCRRNSTRAWHATQSATASGFPRSEIDRRRNTAPAGNRLRSRRRGRGWSRQRRSCQLSESAKRSPVAGGTGHGRAPGHW